MAYGREMTRELLEIGVKYQEIYKDLIKGGMHPLLAKENIYKLWKEEPLKENLRFNRTFTSVEFLLWIKEWMFKDQKTGKLMEDKKIRSRVFKI